jgi:hypothetical protein
LQTGNRCIADFHAQIATRHHDGIGGIDDLSQHRDRFRTFDLGQQHRFTARCMHQCTSQLHIIRTTWERHGQIVRLDQRSRLDVFFVFVGQGRRSQSAALAIDALVVGQHAATHHDTVHFRTLDTSDMEFQQAVVQQ